MPIENVPDSHKLEEHLSICRETNLYSKRVTMEKLTIEEINELPLTDKEQKSNEAFAKLASIIKYYNDGWVPTPEDMGYIVYSSKLLLWGGYATNGSHCGLGYASSYYGFSYSYAAVGARLAIRDYVLCEFMIRNYEQEYKDLWMEE